MLKLKEAKVALVHDFLTTLGGGERVLARLHKLFPKAPIYTLRYDESAVGSAFSEADVRVAPLGKTWLGSVPSLALPFLPNAVETLPLSEYDLVISSSSAFSKGVLTKPSTLHICYCHTPMRFVWDWTHEYAIENGYASGLKSIPGRLVTHYLRLWDQASAERVDRWVANSSNVAQRIKKYYHQPSSVIYPPVEVVRPAGKAVTSDKPYLLIVSRLSPYKRIDQAIEACAELDQPLVIIGKGNDEWRLKELAGKLQAPVVFLGFQPDQVIAEYYKHCLAFLFPGEDDFGITPVEAMAYGKPVIAYSKGGVKETVVDGKTGILYGSPTTAGLVSAVKQFLADTSQFKAEDCQKQALKFSGAAFDSSMMKVIETAWQEFHEQD